MRTGLVYHPDYLKHKQLPGHPEAPERLEVTLDYFKTTGLIKELDAITAEPATAEDVMRVHSKEHIDSLRKLSEEGGGHMGTDAYVCPQTYSVALLAAGGVTGAGDAVWRGVVDNCFALIRPPGHHASRNRAAGFCYLNNVAIMIRHLQDIYGLKRILLLDWDAHAPDGTIDVFYTDPGVLVISIHQDPHGFYPGTGFMEQTGQGDGKGYTINIPVPAGTGDADYAHIMQEVVKPQAQRFKPEFIVVSAGQDSHTDDYISGLDVTEAGYEYMTQEVMNLAKKYCDSRLVVELEGGYELNALKRSNHAIASTLLGKAPRNKIRGVVRDATYSVLAKLDDFLD